jgi:hypothetical protein
MDMGLRARGLVELEARVDDSAEIVPSPAIDVSVSRSARRLSARSGGRAYVWLSAAGDDHGRRKASMRDPGNEPFTRVRSRRRRSLRRSRRDCTHAEGAAQPSLPVAARRGMAPRSERRQSRGVVGRPRYSPGLVRPARRFFACPRAVRHSPCGTRARLSFYARSGGRPSPQAASSSAVSGSAVAPTYDADSPGR